MYYHDRPHIIARNARYGLILFVVYVIFYAGFVALSAFGPEIMKSDVAGCNLAVVYGFALIVAAFVLAIVYMLLCRDNGDAQGEGEGRGDL